MTSLRNSTSLIAAALIAGLTLTGVAIGQPARGEGKNLRQRGAEAGQAAGEAAPRARRQAGPGFEGPGGQGGPRDQAMELIRFWDNDRLNERLQLTEDQIKGLQDSFDTSKAALDALKDEGKDAHEALRTELEKDNPDLNAVLAADSEISTVNAQLRKIVLSHRVAVQSILTAEQEKSLKEGRREMAGEMRGGRGRGGDEMRGRFQGVETLDELNAALDEAGVPAENRERIIKMWERRQARGGRPGPGGAPMPPPMEDEGGAPLPPLPEEGV